MYAHLQQELPPLVPGDAPGASLQEHLQLGNDGVFMATVGAISSVTGVVVNVSESNNYVRITIVPTSATKEELQGLSHLQMSTYTRSEYYTKGKINEVEEGKEYSFEVLIKGGVTGDRVSRTFPYQLLVNSAEATGVERELQKEQLAVSNTFLKSQGHFARVPDTIMVTVEQQMPNPADSNAQYPSTVLTVTFEQMPEDLVAHAANPDQVRQDRQYYVVVPNKMLGARHGTREANPVANHAGMVMLLHNATISVKDQEGPVGVKQGYIWMYNRVPDASVQLLGPLADAVQMFLPQEAPVVDVDEEDANPKRRKVEGETGPQTPRDAPIQVKVEPGAQQATPREETGAQQATKKRKKKASRKKLSF